MALYKFLYCIVLFRSNYDPVLYHFRDKVRYWLKIAPICIRRPSRGFSSEKNAIRFGTEKLEWCGYPMVV